MNWEQLLSLKRYGDTNKRLRKEQDETRLGFEVDYDRIIFSSEFRSLQDKTQVIPLSKTDFIHTRLTHSLEVSVVGRSLGRKVGQRLLEKYPHLKNIHGYQINDFGAIVAAAALAHDIGNPPFGHSGEKAIGEYFKTGNGNRFKSELTAKEYQDLCDFEGNANGFKILTESRKGRGGGLRLSYATLGAFTKYPKESLPKKPTSHIADKKYGFFQSDKEAFMDVATELGLKQTRDGNDISFARHPLTFLVEAADDICYTIIDFEDGINFGLIQEEYALEYLINLVRDTINKDNYSSLTNTEDRISYLRALAINTLINESVEIFMSNEESILNGTFENALLDMSRYKAQIKDIIDISVKNVYNSMDVIDKEIAGYEVINVLLDSFVYTVYKHHKGNLSNYDQLILKVLPETLDLKDNALYHNILDICNFVARFSDSNAIQTYRKLKGNHL
ncbi:deoxyguanosinetriphosphate triphosphohydrolase [Subsaxibacter sp. CAU 1640]|uniref:deoxyguanosinetriphosphate triphosphohydrolase n=1 Tax=Subsaxibacter sp. CAU 1640 TaxID=2933271 RepID=UPI002005A8E3|nr:deoxyguanosinetriphosphate triphosphohydrolase [Subsaxibacter sp. CAU 1640]MCK7589247.1 deoxyguanosinetriphosphate triphosphohydrolase [Subsaxibacter sp. CAU 1640]